MGDFFCSLSKILKCAANDDKVTMKAGYDDDVDKIKLVFEAASKFYLSPYLLDEHLPNILLSFFPQTKARFPNMRSS